MALKSNRTDGSDVIVAQDINQFHDLLTGAMADQPVALASSLTMGATAYLADGVTPTPVGVETGKEYDQGGMVYNVKAWGAKGDTQFVTDGAMSSGSAVLTSASAVFVAADVTKLITVPKAGALITPPAVAIVATDGGVGGTTLPTGSYTFVATWFTGYGETTVGSSSVVYSQTVANHIIVLTMPALPAKAGGFRIYCTVAPGTSSTFIGLVTSTGGTVFNYTTGLTAGNASVAPGANAASTTLVTTIASFQSAGQVTLTAANASGASVSSSFVNWGTDDTAKINLCITAAALTYGEIEIPPVPVGYMISDELTLPAQDTQIRGGGVRSLYGNTGTATAVTVNVPSIAPYLAGSVLIQTATGKDGFKSTKVGPTLNMRDIGIRFTNWFAGTGHGFNLVPPALFSAFDQGLYDSIWSGLKVFGHDGNHYAFNLLDPLYNIYHGLRGYGGGFISLAENSGAGVPCGNEVLTNPYGLVMVAGTSHGINQTGTQTMNGIIFTAWVRPQTWVQDVTALAAFSTLTPPTSAQYGLWSNDNVAIQSWITPDFETNVGSLARFPRGRGNFIGAGSYTPDLVWNTVQNNPISGTSYKNLLGTGTMYTYTATLNPTGGAAATVLAEISADNSGWAEVAKLSAPATGLVGQVQSMSFYIQSAMYFRITLTNATQQWTTFSRDLPVSAH